MRRVERYAMTVDQRRLGGLTDMRAVNEDDDDDDDDDGEDDGNAKAMDEGGDSDKDEDEVLAHDAPVAPAESLFAFPASTAPLVYANKNEETGAFRDVRFVQDRVPLGKHRGAHTFLSRALTRARKELPVVRLNAMRGLAAMELGVGGATISAAEMRTIAGHMFMPMPVHSSPILALLSARAALADKNKTMPWKPRVVSAIMSIFALRQLVTATRNNFLPFHHSLGDKGKESYVDDCFLGKSLRDAHVFAR